VSFNGISLRFIRFRGTKKPDAEFKFTPGLNVLWGASDTGKTFLVEAIDFMLGSGDQLKDIPERQGYETVELGLTTAKAKDYTLVRSIQGGNFMRFDGLLNGLNLNSKDAVKLAASHSSTKTTNLSRWLLNEIDLDQKKILYSKETGELRSLGFRALAHLCVITAQDISKATSPIEGGQYTDRTRDYGVFKLLLTGVDDSAVIDAPKSPKLAAAPSVEPEVLKQMLAYYEEELAKLTDEPDELDAIDTNIQKQLDEVQSSLAAMESELADTTKERREVFARYSSLTSRAGEIGELLARFKLLDQQYSTDLKRLLAIEETGRYFILLTINTCPLCGATSEHQKTDTDCDGNVAAVAQAAAAEIVKIELLQKELHDTVTVLTKENNAIATERAQLEKDLRQLQKNIDAALSPEFSHARKTYSALVEQRSSVRNAISVFSRVTETKAKIAKNGSHKPVIEADEEDAPVAQYLPKSTLDEFSEVVQSILLAWHFPNATNTYFDEVKRDLVIGGKPRGSRGRGLCAITHSAFTIGLLDYCREHQMPHPGFVVLDSPLLAYKEPQGDDENIAGTDLKQRFYEHLIEFIGKEQLFIVENTEPPADILKTINHETFTGNPNEGRYGLFPAVVKKSSPRGAT